jgi:Flp pilus assembly protein CpaB
MWILMDRVEVARRIERPAWINARTLFGLLLFLLAFLGGQRVLSASGQDRFVWVAARDLASGTRLGPGDVTTAPVRLTPQLEARYVDGSVAVEAMYLSSPVREGEMIARSVLASEFSGERRAMTLPVTPEHAVGGRLSPGDVVDVYATFPDGPRRAVLLLRNAEILEIVTAGGLVVAEESLVGITVEVEDKLAASVATAVRGAELDIVRIDSGSSDPS